MDQVQDANSQARVALARVVQGFGVPVLGQADLLEGLLNDDVPQLPRQIAILTEAARNGMAELLGERVRDGMPPDQAVSLVATEVTSRSAMDTAGAVWAAELFAGALGYPVGGQPKLIADETQVESGPPVTAPGGSAPGGSAPPTQVMHRGIPPVTGPGLPGDNQATIVSPGGSQWLGGPQVPGQPYQAQQWQPGQPVQVRPADADLPPIAAPVAACAGVATFAAVVLQLGWADIPRSQAGETVFWISTLVVLFTGIGAGIAAFSDRRTGRGLAAITGLVVPVIAWSIYETAFAPHVEVSEVHRNLLSVVSAFSLVAAVIATVFAIAGLGSRHQLGRTKADGLAVILVILGVIYPLTNILPQEKFGTESFGNVLGSGVHGSYVIYGLLFIVLFALPAVLAAFLVPGSRAQVGLWTGWVLLVLGWQISDTPTDGERVTAGLVVSWLCWALVLAGTVVLAARGRRAR